MNREREIEARVNAATPGAWHRDTHPQEPIIASRTEGETWYSIAPVCQVCYGDWTETDADLIANAPADLRYLLARVRELESERDAAREALRPFAANAHLWEQRSVFDPVYVLIDDDAEIEPGALVIRAGALLSARDITKEISE